MLHPEKEELVLYKDYVQLAGENGFQIPNDYLGGRCPVCKRRMKVRGGHKKNDGHFYHNDSEFCPTKNPAKKPYLGKKSNNIDFVAMANNIEFVKNNINSIWCRLNEMIPYLDLKEFFSILKKAHSLNIYGYTNLKSEFIPYVYVTLINFLPSKSKNKDRILKFCFFYDSSVEKYEDLWINRGIDSNLVRISYSGSETKKVTLFEMSQEYIDKKYNYNLSDKQKNSCISKIGITNHST